MGREPLCRTVQVVFGKQNMTFSIGPEVFGIEAEKVRNLIEFERCDSYGRVRCLGQPRQSKNCDLWLELCRQGHPPAAVWKGMGILKVDEGRIGCEIGAGLVHAPKHDVVDWLTVEGPGSRDKGDRDEKTVDVEVAHVRQKPIEDRPLGWRDKQVIPIRRADIQSGIGLISQTEASCF